MSKDEIIKQLRDMAKHPTVTLPRDCDVLRAAADLLEQPEQEPVAWMHNSIRGNVIAHRPADLDRNPDRWIPLYKNPKPCPTCEALARTVMMDQTGRGA